MLKAVCQNTLPFHSHRKITTLEFPRFRGHLILWENGGHDAKNKTSLDPPEFRQQIVEGFIEPGAAPVTLA